MPGGKYYERTTMPKKNIMVATKKKAPSNKSLNKKIKNIENNLIELKYKDVFNSATAIPVTGLLINGMNFTSYDGGFAANPERSGNEIRATSLSIKGTIKTDFDNLDGARVRMIVFWDRQPNGANAVMLGDNGLLQNNVVTNPVFAPRNYSTIDRYTILYDEIFAVTPQAGLTVVAGVTTQVLEVNKIIDKYLKLSRQMKYDANNENAITESVSNSINVMLIGDEATAGEQATWTGGVRLYFKD